jgi:hypothetical protein
MMESVYKSLKPGGRFVAEMGGKGNVQQLIAATKQVLRKQRGYHKQAKTRFGISRHWASMPAIGNMVSAGYFAIAFRP